MGGAQAFERRDNVFLAHLHRIGDHARGLFEAEASIAVSAAHAPENVEIVFLGHFRFRQSIIFEKPTFCAVINSVAVSGSLRLLTTTRRRTNIRHASPRHSQ